jgi:hypothetical protein
MAKQIRSYKITVKDNLKVTDWTSGEPKDITSEYDNVPEDLKVARISASIDVYADGENEIDTRFKYQPDDPKSLAHYQALMRLFLEDFPKLLTLAKT